MHVELSDTTEKVCSFNYDDSFSYQDQAIMTNVSYVTYRDFISINNHSLRILIGALAITTNLILFTGLISSPSIHLPSNTIICSSFFIGILFGGFYIMPR
ncbi:hypothetical protein TrispH2_010629 [Trichoplax sp. H2]|nr:hypothetical protein TrispH2_010629 [Trichoplax sp. H2]|eukprot:RDD38797.1 hypothetical protein TrispH2_010629 [Trichoplax sp. H2]